jgi:hypothetical protein
LSTIVNLNVAFTSYLKEYQLVGAGTKVEKMQENVVSMKRWVMNLALQFTIEGIRQGHNDMSS